LAKAAACNPCAAKKACAPCNPCNPCAAKKACSPCNPCAAAEAPELSSDELAALANCVTKAQKTAYRGAGYWGLAKWSGFTKVSKHGYVSDTHGGRFVDNLVNKIGKAQYAKYADETKMPVGSTIAKPSFTVGKHGKVTLGPIFLMEKMTKGFDADGGDWRYAMAMPGGKMFGLTSGVNSAGMKFCNECHASAEDADYMLYLPEEARK
jgi:hypothetical protein